MMRPVLDGIINENYTYCESLNQRMAKQVCERRLSERRCVLKRDGTCRIVKKQNLSDEERTRRSERMKKMRKEVKKS